MYRIARLRILRTIPGSWTFWKTVRTEKIWKAKFDWISTEKDVNQWKQQWHFPPLRVEILEAPHKPLITRPLLVPISHLSCFIGQGNRRWNRKRLESHVSRGDIFPAFPFFHALQYHLPPVDQAHRSTQVFRPTVFVRRRRLIEPMVDHMTVGHEQASGADRKADVQDLLKEVIRGRWKSHC